MGTHAAHRIAASAVIGGVMAAGLALGTGAAAAQGDRDCPSFASQQEAQSYFDANGGSPDNNVDRLDADNDGIACETGTTGGSGAPDGDASGGAADDAEEGGPMPQGAVDAGNSAPAADPYGTLTVGGLIGVAAVGSAYGVRRCVR